MGDVGSGDGEHALAEGAMESVMAEMAATICHAHSRDI
jgi:roadblock/LC7 domain-containing protein